MDAQRGWLQRKEATMIRVCVRRTISKGEVHSQSKTFIQLEGKPGLFSTDGRDWWVTDVEPSAIERGSAITFVLVDILFEELYGRCRMEITAEGFSFSAKRKDCPEAFFSGVVESVLRN